MGEAEVSHPHITNSDFCTQRVFQRQHIKKNSGKKMICYNEIEVKAEFYTKTNEMAAG